MPSSVSKLFNEAGLDLKGPVKWGKIVREDNPGVYVICLSDNPDDIKNSCIEKAPLEKKLIKFWTERIPKLQIKNTEYTSKMEALKYRLSEFWLPDEVILYIGQTDRTINKRTQELYIHILGDSKPHNGGQWIHTLQIRENLYIYWAITKKSKISKSKLLDMFMENVSMKTKENLYYPFLPLPFANLKIASPSSVKTKKHDISNQRI